MSNDALWCGHAATDIHDEPHDQVGEVEATVESVGERAKVAIAVLAVPEGFVGTGQTKPPGQRARRTTSAQPVSVPKL